jgi:hypothetical protein
VLRTKIVEVAQRLAGEITNLWVVPLLLELRNHHDGEDHFVFSESKQRARVGEQDRGVKNIGSLRG